MIEAGHEGAVRRPRAWQGPDAATTIEVVAVPAQGGSDHALSGIEAPRAGERFGSYSLSLKGYVLGKTSPARELRVTHRGRLVAATPVRDHRDDVGAGQSELPWGPQSGFGMRIGTATLPRRFRLELEALLEDGSVVPVGAVEGERRQLPQRVHSCLQPIVITALPHSGSRRLAQALERDPSLAVYAPRGYGARVAAYQAEWFRLLSEPRSHLQIAYGLVDSTDWWLGSGTQPAVTDAELETEAWLGSAFVEDALGRICERLESFYREAPWRDGPPATHFVEIYDPECFVQDLLWEVYPGMREIFLVRDLRDVVATIVASGGRGLPARPGAGADGLDQARICEWIGDQASALLDARSRRAQQAFVLGYEDLVRTPAAVLPALFDYLGVDGAAPTKYLRSSGGGGAAGRWRDELDDEAQRVCNEALCEQLALLGYPPG